VVAGALAVETIGVAIFSVAFFSGQITFGVLVDRIGIAPGGRRPVSTARLQAALVAVAAVVVSQIGRPVAEFAPGLVALVVAAGAALAFQSAFNGRIAAATAMRSPPPQSTWWSASSRWPRSSRRSRRPGTSTRRTGRRSRGCTPAASWAVEHQAPTPGVIAGAALIVAAAALVGRRPATRLSGRQ